MNIVLASHSDLLAIAQVASPALADWPPSNWPQAAAGHKMNNFPPKMRTRRLIYMMHPALFWPCFYSPFSPTLSLLLLAFPACLYLAQPWAAWLWMTDTGYREASWPLAGDSRS